MATLADTGYPTILNVARRLTPQGSVVQSIAELLEQENPFLQDVPWVEGNLPTGHRIASRTAMPVPTWRRINQGLDPTKSDTTQFDETTGMLEAYSKVDVDAAKLGGNPAAFRATEDSAFVEAFSQSVATAIFYESAVTNPERIHGLSARYPATTGYTSSSYVLKPGTNAGVNAQSIWLITWKPGRVYGIYPRGSTGGLAHEDMGIQLVNDVNGRQFRAYTSHFQWKFGLAVEDYRYALRLQWDPDDTTNFADSAKGMYMALAQMTGSIYKMEDSTRIYMSRASMRKLNAQLMSNEANMLSQVVVSGRTLNAFMGVPIRVVDSLVAESAIS